MHGSLARVGSTSSCTQDCVNGVLQTNPKGLPPRLAVEHIMSPHSAFFTVAEKQHSASSIQKIRPIPMGKIQGAIQERLSKQQKCPFLWCIMLCNLIVECCLIQATEKPPKALYSVFVGMQMKLLFPRGHLITYMNNLPLPNLTPHPNDSKGKESKEVINS